MKTTMTITKIESAWVSQRLVRYDDVPAHIIPSVGEPILVNGASFVVNKVIKQYLTDGFYITVEV